MLSIYKTVGVSPNHAICSQAAILAMALVNVLWLLLLLAYEIPSIAADDEAIIADKVVSNLQMLQSVIETANTTLLSMKKVQSNLLETTAAILKKNERDISIKVADIRKNVTQLRVKRKKSVIDQCIFDVQPLEVLVEAISGEIKECITVALAENVNIITGCIVEAQAFMDLPQKVAVDLQTCGPSAKCLLELSADAVNESIEIPSKVLVLTARIQQLAYHSISSINGCALDGLIYVTQQGLSLVEDILACVAENS
ncbi:hypothetical protein HHI36_012918 [Cryptolaemus montrouzieri]|uniref:Protein TsetseEP domain-containing protein n=1 Tax=Cryptolaemus montrouzieri TaxID=559131 RepID=A0ABD2NFV3_9CUCU